MKTKCRAWPFVVSALAATSWLGGCGEKPDLRPPEIRSGQQECEQCRMIISEARFAAAVVTETNNRVEKFAFDDVGCLLDWRREHREPIDFFPYVHDHETGRWLDAHQARFIRSEKLATPMASGLAASESDAGVKRLLERYQGSTARFSDLLKN